MITKYSFEQLANNAKYTRHLPSFHRQSLGRFDLESIAQVCTGQPPVIRRIAMSMAEIASASVLKCDGLSM